MIDIIELFKTLFLQLKEITGGGDMLPAVLFMGAFGTISFWAVRLVNFVPNLVWRHFTTSMTVNSKNDIFYKLMFLLERCNISSKTRSISFASHRNNFKSIGIGTHYTFLYGTLVKIEYDEETSGTTVIAKIRIVKLGRSHKLFNKLFSEVNKDEEDQDKTTDIKRADKYTLDWIKAQEKSSIENIVLSQVNKDNLLLALDNFKNNKEWYKNRSIPYQLGILLEGPPGTGKTSLVRAIAGYMNRDIVMVDSAEGLKVANNQANNKDLIIIEEVDTLGTLKRNITDDEETEPKLSNDNLKSKADLGKLLTEMDGIITNEGRILILTTNDVRSLDKSLLRPGRIDLQMHLGYLTKETFFKMIDKFEISYTKEEMDNFTIKGSVSPADLQQELIAGKDFSELEKVFGI